MKKFRLLSVAAFTLLTPLVAAAQAANSGGGVCSYDIDSIAVVFHLFGCILSTAVLPMLVTLAIIVFIWGVVKYISKADDSTEREEGRKFMLYGIIGLFVIVSVWGLVGIIQGTFGLSTNPLIPQLQGI